MSFALQIFGTALLSVAGLAGGMRIYQGKVHDWWQVHTLARLFGYWEDLLRYQPLSGRDLLSRAMDFPDFAAVGVRNCSALHELDLPSTLQRAFRRELWQGLTHLAEEPRQTACKSLHRMKSLCEEAAAQKWKEAQSAKQLWPKLGVCIGLLIGVLMRRPSWKM